MGRKYLFACMILTCSVTAAAEQQTTFGPGDPQIKDPQHFDSLRPIDRELQSNVPDGFTVAAVGDLIISRPLSQYGQRMPAFKAVLDLLQHTDVTYGNMESTIFDPRSFSGAPYSWDGDWTVSSLPAVAQDLKDMGFSIVSRANNHALDWGLEGMRETGRWLDAAGISHAGAGETHGLARAPQYFESARGRVALVSLASSFRPTTDSLPTQGAVPGRAGISALHLSEVIEVPQDAIAPLAEVQCTLYGKHCDDTPTEGELFGTAYRQAKTYSHAYTMDAVDLAEIYQSIRAAQENADFVIVSIHAHQCSPGCDDEQVPFGAAEFLKQLAHDAIDSGADLFVVTGNHNLGPIEIYHSPARGDRPVFYGMGNFFWSDIQEMLSHDLFHDNHDLLAETWKQPDKATDFDLSAPLNKVSFAHAFTFQSVIAETRFEHNKLSSIVLHPVELGYGGPATESGIPRVVTDAGAARAIFAQIVDQTAGFGLPLLNITYSGTTAEIQP